MRPLKNKGFFKISKSAFNPLRNQYDASKIIVDFLNQDNNNHHNEYRLLVVNVDIYAPQFNFIFGLANVRRNTAIVSINRLCKEYLTAERLKKEAVHEVGHLLGLNHCLDVKCVMYFSNSASNTDNKIDKLCKKCRRSIEKL